LCITTMSTLTPEWPMATSAALREALQELDIARFLGDRDRIAKAKAAVALAKASEPPEPPELPPNT
jgi:hypothetical protein